jgi:NAD(P)H dehydrogenase (quinone)
MLVHGMVIQGSHAGDHYGPVAVGEPDQRAATMARHLGERVAALAERLAD